jgi:hypothetical protein
MRAQPSFHEAHVQGLVLLTSLELTLNHAWMIPTVPMDVLLAKAALPPDLDHPPPMDGTFAPRVLRVATTPWYPNAWSQTSEMDRLEQCVLWDRMTLRPKHHLNQRLALVRSSTSFSSREQRALCEWLDESRVTNQRLWADLLKRLSVEYVIAPTSERLPHLEPSFATRKTPFDADFRWYRVPDTRPRAWLVPRSVVETLTHDDTVLGWKQRLRQYWSDDPPVHDWDEMVAIAEEPRSTSLSRGADEVDAGRLVGNCQIVYDRGARLRLRARLVRPGWLVLNDTYASGWRAARWTRGQPSQSAIDVPVHRANQLMRALELPAGDHEIEFRYAPTSLGSGLVLSGLGILVTSVLSWVNWRASRAMPLAPRKNP